MRTVAISLGEIKTLRQVVMPETDISDCKAFIQVHPNITELGLKSWLNLIIPDNTYSIHESLSKALENMYGIIPKTKDLYSVFKVLAQGFSWEKCSPIYKHPTHKLGVLHYIGAKKQTYSVLLYIHKENEKTTTEILKEVLIKLAAQVYHGQYNKDIVILALNQENKIRVFQNPSYFSSALSSELLHMHCAAFIEEGVSQLNQTYLALQYIDLDSNTFIDDK